MALRQRQNTPDCAPTQPVSAGLSAEFQEAHLRLLVRSPCTLFAFWEFAPGAQAAAVRAAGAESGMAPRSVLRLFATKATPDERPLEIADFLLEEDETSRYIPVPRQGVPYRLEWGVATGAGEFIPLCSSNEVKPPDATIHPLPAAPAPLSGVAPAAGGAIPRPDTLSCNPAIAAGSGDLMRSDAVFPDILALLPGSMEQQGIPVAAVGSRVNALW